MANYNLTGQEIRNSYPQLGQVSGSIEGGVEGSAVVDGTGSRITTLHVTASQATNATSASFATTALSASYAPGTGVTSIIAGTGISVDQATGNVTINSSGGGGSVDTGSLLTTASNVDATITYTKGDGSTFQNIINNVANATEAEDLVITVKNTSGGTLAKGTAVHAVSVTGENIDVIAASNDSASAMPAIGLLSVELTNNSAGTCIIAGRDTGLNTSGLVAGASIYVSTGGALTSTKPIGSALIQNIGTAAKIDASDGEIIIQGAGRTNDLPNLIQDYVWKGDSNGVPQAVDQSTLSVSSALTATSASYAVTSSHVTDTNVAYINKNNTFTGTQSFDNISVAGTGSFAYIQSVTGSAKTIGDAFIILNNNTPTQVYAGVKVQDSGSTATTASIQWDGINDQWFFEKEVGAAGEFGVVMGGPEYSDIASPAYLTNNRIAKGNGSHHLNDSNISDNGSVVDINSNTQITGSVNIKGSLTQSGSDLSFFTNGNAGGETKTIAYSDTTNAGGTTYTENYFGIIDYPPGLYDNALTMFKSTPAFGQYSHNFSNGDSAGVQLKAVSGSYATINVFTGFDGSASVGVSGDKIFITAADLLKINFPGGTTQISSSVGISGSLEVQHGAQMNAGIAISGSTESEVVTLGIASNTSSLDATNGSFFTLNLVDGADTHINQSSTTPGQTYTLKTTNGGAGTGTISFNSGFKFSDATAPTATATAAAVDIYTFVTYTANEVYATAVTNLS